MVKSKWHGNMNSSFSVNNIANMLREIKEKEDLIQRKEMLKISKNLLMLEKKDLLCSGIQTYCLWNRNCLSSSLDVLVIYPRWKQNHRGLECYENCWCQQILFRNFWKNLWWSTYLSTFRGSSMSLSKAMIGGAILHSPT